MADKIICGALVYDAATRTFQPLSVHICGEHIAEVAVQITSAENAEIIDGTGMYLIPGLVDVHSHGRLGLDFTDVGKPGKGKAEIDRVLQSYAKEGTTSVMVTLASAPFDEWLNTARILTEHAGTNHPGAHIPGIHLEGNYLSPKRRGAHAPELLRKPDCGELDQICRYCGRMRMHISVAPELEGSEAFIKDAASRGVTVGIAHTDATYEEAMEAIRWGATSFTHTFNTMTPLHHRQPGCVCAALMADAAYAELICDGMHSHPATARLLRRTKPQDKLVLITDSMEAAGCPDGEYQIAGLPVFVKDGKAVNAEGALAGSTISLMDGLRNFIAFTGASLEEALPAATENPARMIGAENEIGKITAGYRADLVLIRDKASPRAERVFVGGNEIK